MSEPEVCADVDYWDRKARIYLAGDWESGGVMVQCERDECRVPGNCAAGLCWWHSEPLYNPTLEQLAAVMADHIATHPA